MAHGFLTAHSRLVGIIKNGRETKGVSFEKMVAGTWGLEGLHSCCMAVGVPSCGGLRTTGTSQGPMS